MKNHECWELGEAKLPQQSDGQRMMLINASRIAYRGVRGRPSARNLGAWVIYLSLKRPFDISIGGSIACRANLALVEPNVSHRVATPDRDMAEVLVEPETIDGERLADELMGTIERRENTYARIREGFTRGPCAPDEFDQQFFGQNLPGRVLDPRIVEAITRINKQPSRNLTAESCAVHAGLSCSRFRHLFSSETGMTFRRFRAWKRARGLISMLNEEAKLVDVALRAGYADSTHFSHAIRQFYGYRPRDMFATTRRISVIRQWSPNPAAV